MPISPCSCPDIAAKRESQVFEVAGFRVNECACYERYPGKGSWILLWQTPKSEVHDTSYSVAFQRARHVACPAAAVYALTGGAQCKLSQIVSRPHAAALIRSHSV